MIQEVSKGPRVALCRECGGSGVVISGRFIRKEEICPQCEGSGRVIVSSKQHLIYVPIRNNLWGSKRTSSKPFILWPRGVA